MVATANTLFETGKMNFAATKTPGGYAVGEVTSAMQKAIRRGQEEAALFWATELDLAGFGAYAWKRLRIITSEDIGLAEPAMPATIRALFDNWTELEKEFKKTPGPRRPSRMFLVHAVLLLARAKKSRTVDHALIVYYKGNRKAMEMDIPDEAYDQHTARGRQMGRGVNHFFDEAAKFANPGLVDDHYRDRARSILGGKVVEETDGPED